MKLKITRDLIIQPGFDKRNPDPKKNYGVHGCELWFIVKTKNRAITVRLNASSWLPPHTQEEYLIKHPRRFQVEPTLPVIAWHSKKKYPYYDLSPECDFLGGRCYNTVGYTYADETPNILLTKGSEGVFEWMEEELIKEFYPEEIPAKAETFRSE